MPPRQNIPVNQVSMLTFKMACLSLCSRMEIKHTSWLNSSKLSAVIVIRRCLLFQEIQYTYIFFFSWFEFLKCIEISDGYVVIINSVK